MSDRLSRTDAVAFKEETFKTWFLGIFGFAYFSQGFSLGSMALLFPLYIEEELNAGSYSASLLVSVIMISPWYFKFVFGILSDNFPIGRLGRRKSYLIISTVFSAIGWLTIGLHDEVTSVFVLSGLSIGIGSALADSVIDGQGVELTPIQFSGRLQGVSWGSRGLGIGMIGIVSTNLIDRYDWQTMFNVSAIFGISLSLAMLILPQIKYEKSKETVPQIVKRSFSNTLLRPGNKKLVWYLVFSGIGIAVIPLLSIIMKREFGYGIKEVGYGAVTFAIGNFLGAVINGLVFDQKETPKRITLMLISFALSIGLGIALTQLNVMIFQFSWLFIIGITTGAFEGYQLKIIQENSPESYEGTAFSIYTGISNISQFAVGGFLIVYFAELIDISILVVMQILVLAVIAVGYQLHQIKFDKS